MIAISQKNIEKFLKHTDFGPLIKKQNAGMYLTQIGVKKTEYLNLSHVNFIKSNK